ncbi:response regulator [Actinoplanes sp. NPDC049599]|uniref:response regulator n=1 Tax=Actinoplanes sp. NPDC049599 TaxID=3363903 RepID=UPI00378BB2F1
MQAGGRSPARRILVVDERLMARTLSIVLRARGYDVTTAGDGPSALTAAADFRPEVVLLDPGLPDVGGVDLIPRLGDHAAIIVLSGREDAQDKVRALDAGADDYLTKPFVDDELLARIRAIVRRPRPARKESRVLFVGKYRVDLDARIVSASSGDVRLTRTEWRLLESFLRQPGRVLGHRRLLTEVWGPQYAQEAGYLRQYMARLRHKLEADPARPRHFLTESGVGYRFQS